MRAALQSLRRAAGVGVGLVLCGVSIAQTVPAHLDLLSAGIREIPPVDPRDIGSRTVVLELELAGPPTCNSSTGFLSYGFFMDSDRDPLTGLTDPALAGLGVDARVSAECDGTSGLFTSEAGSVSVGPGPGGSTLITITMQVGDLPAVEFDWLAFAHEDVNLTRLPQFPEHATWAIFERSLP